MLQFHYLDIDGFNLLSSDVYGSIQGILDGDQDVITNELYTSGQSYNRSKVKEKKLVLNILIKNNVLTNLFSLRQKLFKTGLKTLTVGIVGMPIFYVKFDLSNWLSNPLGSHMFTCQLLCPDPFLHEATQHSIQLGILTAASALTYPITYPITYGNPTGSTGTITNLGNMVGYPVVTVVGTCSNIIVTNQTTGESMSVNISLGANDTLIIDNTVANRGIYLNGAKRMDLKNGSWISCPPGDNVFLFGRSSLESKLHCTVSFQGVWI